MIYLFFTFFLLVIELIYFKIANHYSIIDKPNERSSHSEITIRGGGIVFWVASLLYFIYSGFTYPYFFFGLTCVAIISFFDDMFNLPNRIRLPFQFLAIGMALLQTNYFEESYWIFAFLLIIGVGIVNTYNFMDGINGLTGGYSLVALISLWYINTFICVFIDNEFLYFIIGSLLIFNYFNFRNKAKCFAGDVGSISMGVIVIFLLLKLISIENQFQFILILAVYGVDSVLTIIQRIFDGKNIFKAHNSHFYQVVVRNLKLPHIKVASFYMVVQILINIILIKTISFELILKWLISITILVFLTSFYLYFKPRNINLN